MICPDCKGSGGEYDAVLWHGIGGGPYYECDYCHGKGKVSLGWWLHWYIVVIFWGETVAQWLYKIGKSA